MFPFEERDSHSCPSKKSRMVRAWQPSVLRRLCSTSTSRATIALDTSLGAIGLRAPLNFHQIRVDIRHVPVRRQSVAVLRRHSLRWVSFPVSLLKSRCCPAVSGRWRSVFRPTQYAPAARPAWPPELDPTLG